MAGESSQVPQQMGAASTRESVIKAVYLVNVGYQLELTLAVRANPPDFVDHFCDLMLINDKW